MEELARGIHESIARLRAEWGAALNEMTRESTQLLDELSGSVGYGGVAGSLGELIGLASSEGRESTIKYTHPALTRPSGTNVTLTAPTLDERTLDTLVTRVTEQVRARLAFDDGRYGQS